MTGIRQDWVRFSASGSDSEVPAQCAARSLTFDTEGSMLANGSQSGMGGEKMELNGEKRADLLGQINP